MRWLWLRWKWHWRLSRLIARSADRTAETFDDRVCDRCGHELMANNRIYLQHELFTCSTCSGALNYTWACWLAMPMKMARECLLWPMRG